MPRLLALAALTTLPMIAHAGFEASSFKRDAKRGEAFWNAGSALDSRLESCWMIDPEEKNEGQWLQVDIPAAEVDKIAVVIGWDKSENNFFDYARIKKARIEVIDLKDQKPTTVVEHEATFEDKRGWQIIDIPNGKVAGEIIAGRVRMTVTEVYPGKDYPNLAVSEMRVHLKEFNADTTNIHGIPSSESDDHMAMDMIDDNARTYWTSVGETQPSFSVEAPGYGLASIGIQAGPKSHARPKVVEITANGVPQKHNVEDKTEMQWFLLPVMVGYTGSAWAEIKVQILESYPGEVGKGVAISEVKLNAATIEDF